MLENLWSQDSKAARDALGKQWGGKNTDPETLKLWSGFQLHHLRDHWQLKEPSFPSYKEEIILDPAKMLAGSTSLCKLHSTHRCLTSGNYYFFSTDCFKKLYIADRQII